jgi:hypothetical protein
MDTRLKVGPATTAVETSVLVMDAVTVETDVEVVVTTVVVGTCLLESIIRIWGPLMNALVFELTAGPILVVNVTVVVNKVETSVATATVSVSKTVRILVLVELAVLIDVTVDVGTVT